MADLDRTKVTFEQAEGLEPLPSQLKPRELNKALRARLWAMLYTHLSSATEDYDHTVSGTWRMILRDFHVVRLHKPLDEFNATAQFQTNLCKSIILEGTYERVLGTLQYFLRHRQCPSAFREHVEQVLLACRAGYRLLDGRTFIPIASEEDAKVAERAFADLNADVYSAARKHLVTAAERLTAGDWPGGVRESMQAVKSVVRVLTGKKTFGDALRVLEQRWGIHRALKAAFGSLYGYTSEEPGIRHPLLDDPEASVDEADALFMFGACSAFVTYLIEKAKN